jgi:hypothetical protein
MNISDVISSAMDTSASAVEALIPNTVAGQSPQVTSNASPFDQHGAKGGSTSQSSNGLDFLSKIEHAMEALVSSAFGAIPMIGSALASLTAMRR